MKEILSDGTRVPNERFTSKLARSNSTAWKARPDISGDWEGEVKPVDSEEQPYVEIDITENGRPVALVAVRGNGNVKDYSIETRSGGDEMMIPQDPKADPSGTPREYFRGNVIETFEEPIDKTKVVRFVFVTPTSPEMKTYKLKLNVWICEETGMFMARTDMNKFTCTEKLIMKQFAEVRKGIHMHRVQR